MIQTYVDSRVLIEVFRGTSSLAIPALAILSDPNRSFVTSEFVRLEVLPKPTYFRRVNEVAFSTRFLAVTSRSAPITKGLVRLAMQRAEEFGLSAVDAIHVAAAEKAGAAELVTAERPTSPLARVTSIRIISIHP